MFGRKTLIIPILPLVVLLFPSLSQGVVETGDLQITAKPGLRVYLDEADNFVGKTNEEDDGLYLEGLSVGAHTVIVKKTGFLPGRFTIEIRPGKAIELTIGELRPDIRIIQRGEEKEAEVEVAVGSLKVRSVPLKCEIRFLSQNTNKEKDEVIIEGIPSGTYPIEFRRKGQVLTHEVTIVTNTQLELLVHFKEGKVTEIAAIDMGDMILIPAGEFLMGSNDGDDDEKPVRKVYTDAYCIDKYEVTNVQFCEFLNEKGNQKEDEERWLDTNDEDCLIEYREGKYRPKRGYRNHSVVCVTWYGARAYAKWAGKRLPNEVEWEKAARGGLVGKRYPWGDRHPDGSQCNFADKNNKSKWSDKIDKTADDGYSRTAPVGSYAPNGYGLYDTAGNVCEWCSDADWNHVGQGDTPYRIHRGGSWDNCARLIRCANRRRSDPRATYNYVGFRCARSLE